MKFIETWLPTSSTLDGYIRLNKSALDMVKLTHYVTLRDHDLLHECAGIAVCAGVTEWLGQWQTDGRSLSFGWDWYLDIQGRMSMWGADIRSNVMLIDAVGVDLGPQQTNIILYKWLNLLAWTPMVLAASRAFLH